jgi:hypothetical protein
LRDQVRLLTPRRLSVKSALSLFDFLELLECASRFALLRGAYRLVLGADLLLLDADLLFLHADPLLLQAPALGVVSGTSILILGTLRVVLDALDGLFHALLFAAALREARAGQGEHQDETPQRADDETTMKCCHTFSFPLSVPASQTTMRLPTLLSVSDGRNFTIHGPGSRKKAAHVFQQ